MEKITNELAELYNERAKYIEEEEYIKAEEISKKIKLYKENALSCQKNEFRLQQEKDKKNFDENYKRELDFCKQKWAQKEKELNDRMDQIEEQLILSQKEELHLIYNDKNNNVKQRTNPNYLNLKKIQYELVKQERFLEALEVKKKAEKILKEDDEKIKIENQNRIKKRIEKTIKKHQDEKDKFEEERKRKIYLMKKEKDIEMDSIKNKYRSLRVGMNLQQKDEQMKATKRLKTSLRRSSQESTRTSMTTFK